MNQTYTNLKQRSVSLPNLQKRSNFHSYNYKKQPSDKEYDQTRQTINNVRQQFEMPQLNPVPVLYDEPETGRRQTPRQHALYHPKKQLNATGHKQSSSEHISRALNNKMSVSEMRGNSLPSIPSQKSYALIYWQEREKTLANMNKLTQRRKQQIQREVQTEINSRRRSLDRFCPQKRREVEQQLRQYLRQRISLEVDYLKAESVRPSIDQQRKGILRNSKISLPNIQKSQQLKRQESENLEEDREKLHYKSRDRTLRRSVKKSQDQTNEQGLASRRRPKVKHFRTQRKSYEEQSTNSLQNELILNRQDTKFKVFQKQFNRKMQRQVSESLEDSYSQLVLQNQAFKKQRQLEKQLQQQRRIQRKRKIQLKISLQIDKNQQYQVKKAKIDQSKAYPKKRKSTQFKDAQKNYEMKQMFRQIKKKFKNFKDDIKLSQDQQVKRKRKIQKKGLYQNVGFKYALKNSALSIDNSNGLQMSKSLQKSKTSIKNQSPIKYQALKMKPTFYKKKQNKIQCLEIDHIKINQNLSIIQLKGQHNLQKYFDLHYQKLPDLMKKINYCHSNINWLVYTLVKQTKSFTIFQFKKKQKQIGIIVAICKDDYYKQQKIDHQNGIYKKQKGKNQIKKRNINLIHVGSYKESNTLEFICQCAYYMFNKDPCDQISFSFAFNSVSQKQTEFLGLFGQEFQKIGYIYQNLGKGIKIDRKYTLKRQRFFSNINKKQHIQQRPQLLLNSGEICCTVDMLVSQQFLGIDQNFRNNSSQFIIPGLMSLFIAQYVGQQKIKQFQALQLDKQYKLAYLKQLIYNVGQLNKKFRSFIKSFTYLRAKKYQTPSKLIQQMITKEQQQQTLKCLQDLIQRKIPCYRYYFLHQMNIYYKYMIQDIIFKRTKDQEYHCKYFRFQVGENLFIKEKQRTALHKKLSTEIQSQNDRFKIQCLRSDTYKRSTMFMVPSTKPEYKVVIMTLSEFDRMDENHKNLNQFMYDFIKNSNQRILTNHEVLLVPQIKLFQNQKKKPQPSVYVIKTQNTVGNQTQQSEKQKQNQKPKTNENNLKASFVPEQMKIIPNFKSKIHTKFSYFHKTYLQNSMVYQLQQQQSTFQKMKNQAKTTDTQPQQEKLNATENNSPSKDSPKKSLSSKHSKQLIIRPPFLIGMMDIKLQQEFGNGLLYAKRIDIQDLSQLRINKLNSNGIEYR